MGEAVALESTPNTKEGEQEAGMAESGQVLRCAGPQLLCPPRAVNALAYAYSRAGLDVKGLSTSKLRHLIDEGLIRFPSDLFTAFGSENTEDTSVEEEEMLSKIADLPGWGALSSRNLAESVRAVGSIGVPLSRYIYSLGIPLVGTQASQLIAATYGNANAFLQSLEDASLCGDDTDENNDASNTSPFAALTGGNGTEKVKGIGPSAICSLLSFSREEVMMNAAKDLANVLTVHDDSDQQISSSTLDDSRESKPFEGMTVVFTGALKGISRATAQKTAKKLGAKATPTAVSKATTLVVVGEKGGKKARQAIELGIRVIDSAEFMKMIGV